MQALIIAAGQGTRLRSEGPSKPLVRLHGRPLIAHVVERLKLGGITECVVVTGYLRETLEHELSQISSATGISIRSVFNPDWELANGVSVLAAQSLLAEKFILSMCDHLVDPELIQRMVATSDAARPGLAVDFNIKNPDVDLDDVTRVSVTKGEILRIGKNISDYNGFDCGVFSGSGLLITALEKARKDNPSVSISDGVMSLDLPLRAIDVTGLRWIDVDDPAMFARASAWIGTC